METKKNCNKHSFCMVTYTLHDAVMRSIQQLLSKCLGNCFLMTCHYHLKFIFVLALSAYPN